MMMMIRHSCVSGKFGLGSVNRCGLLVVGGLDRSKFSPFPVNARELFEKMSE